MITPIEIKEKAERKYISSFLPSLIKNTPFEEIIIRGDKSYSKSLTEFEKEIQKINSQSKDKTGFGYTVSYQQVKTKLLGRQDLPILISFKSENDLLKFLGKENEVKLFKKNVELIINAFPILRDWIISEPKNVIKYQNKWDDILKVCNYFKINPKPNLYIRELPIKVHTKFIENNKGIIKDILNLLIPEHINDEEKEFEKRFNLKFSEPQIRFKILDKAIAENFFSGVDDLSVTVSQFENLNLPIKKVLVVENKTTLYTTLTLPKMKDSIAIFGSGYSVCNLQNTQWFNKIDLFYWGDIDVQGFEILSQFRGYFPHAKSVLMDSETFEIFFENDIGTETKVSILLNLSDNEQGLYSILKTNNWRLEQEKISFDYVTRFFDSEINSYSSY